MFSEKHYLGILWLNDGFQRIFHRYSFHFFSAVRIKRCLRTWRAYPNIVRGYKNSAIHSCARFLPRDGVNREARGEAPRKSIFILSGAGNYCSLCI